MMSLASFALEREIYDFFDYLSRAHARIRVENDNNPFCININIKRELIVGKEKKKDRAAPGCASTSGRLSARMHHGCAR